MSESDYQAIRRELPRRSKVWEAISDLDYSPPDISNVVRACRESGYSWKELDRIARYEVAPAIWFSWDYFFPKDGVSFDMFVDVDWLNERTLKLVRRRRHALRIKLLGRLMMARLEERWREVERRFKSGDDGKGGYASDTSGDPLPGG